MKHALFAFLCLAAAAVATDVRAETPSGDWFGRMDGRTYAFFHIGPVNSGYSAWAGSHVRSIDREDQRSGRGRNA
ncbi:MAG TPA: hypothetical protein VG839_00365 [Asticcacaulis sp.]|nr:hypothetical protein [Asticcacaulis sp.]